MLSLQNRVLVTQLLLFIRKRRINVHFALVVRLRIVFRLIQGSLIVLLINVCLVDFWELCNLALAGWDLV